MSQPSTNPFLHCPFRKYTVDFCPNPGPGTPVELSFIDRTYLQVGSCKPTRRAGRMQTHVRLRHPTMIRQDRWPSNHRGIGLDTTRPSRRTERGP